MNLPQRIQQNRQIDNRNPHGEKHQKADAEPEPDGGEKNPQDSVPEQQECENQAEDQVSPEDGCSIA